MRKLKIALLAFICTMTLFVASGTTFLVLYAHFRPTPILPRELEHTRYYPEAPPDTQGFDEEEEVHINSLMGIYEDGNVVDNNLLPWNLTLVNRYNFLDISFEPELEPIGNGLYFDARAAESLFAMLESARKEGLRPIAVSAHRSIERQRTLFENQLRHRLTDGLSFDAAFDAARRVVAYPGTSEHNLGLAVDIVSSHHNTLNSAFGNTNEGIWLAQNSYKYGFILRYPYDKQHITNIIYEPWHFRYVGIEHATAMFERGLVLEEYVIEFLRSR